MAKLIRTTARGTLVGNRGIIHDPQSRSLLSRRWQHQGWICCVLEFKGFQHPIMGAGANTELFYLDEATAFEGRRRIYATRPSRIRERELSLREVAPKSENI